jgi:phenylalanyl-tRNA synthetase alpha subunit
MIERTEMSLTELETETLALVAAAADEAALETVRVNALGKKGTISEQMKALGAMASRTRWQTRLPRAKPRWAVRPLMRGWCLKKWI